MWESIIKSALSMTIQLVSYFLKKANASAEARSAYLAFVEKMQEQSGNSGKLRTSYKEQIERLRAENVKPNHTATK